MEHRKFTIFTISLLFIAAGVWLFLGKQTEVTDSSDSREASVISLETANESYLNPEFNFSFAKPEGYNIGEFEDGGRHIILIQSPKEIGGFQILITPLGIEDIKMTKNIINAEISDMKVENEKEISISGAKGLMFESDNPSFDKASTELWFIYKGNLYQISGYKEAKPVIEQVMNTWKFN